MKHIISLTLSVKEEDPERLHSRENKEKLEMCAEAIEIGTAISFAVSGLGGLDHRTIVDEEGMRVSFVYSMPELIGDEATLGNLLACYGSDRNKLQENWENSKKELASEGIELETKIVAIETLKIPS
jgi:hypothetical protein